MKTFRDAINESMEAGIWDDVHKKLIDKLFFSCTEDYEPKALIAKLKEKYKVKHTANEIADAIKSACNERGNEKGMEHFITRVLKKLL